MWIGRMRFARRVVGFVCCDFGSFVVFVERKVLLQRAQTLGELDRLYIVDSRMVLGFVWCMDARFGHWCLDCFGGVYG